MKLTTTMRHATPRPEELFVAEITPGAFGEILAALQFAAHKHRDQRRLGPEASPYINHPIALANILWREGDVHEPPVICAALLHDTIEDTATTAEELAARFGAAVARIVMEVTDDKTLDKAARKRLQVEHAPHISREAKLVKLADKIANLRDVAASPPAGWATARQREYFDWARDVVDGMRGVHQKLEAVFDEAFSRRP
jgi:GTP diphosphokinase / guanosine-3',5'-bis(diphosphate) 3'-diphosphatase